MLPTRQIPREEIKALPLFAGLTPEQVRLAATPELAAAALRALGGCAVLGFDTESRPTFHKGEKPTGPHLIQLASDDGAWLFPVQDGQCAPELKILLEDPQRLLVGFELSSDQSLLKQRLGIRCGRVLDLVSCFDSDDARITVGAVQAVARLFGQYFRKSKKLSTTNWSKLPLTPAQQAYAGNDAWVALRVFRALEARGRLPPTPKLKADA
ncbi:3'-5' exonuclease domain-containing protein 2 [Chromobacterium haemolyticum]|uniref:3'-5' exonuclease domain-containing protein 2 n=1 Tax=Chromobacterium fluminis TaxID=3044269 RepID=A0ABX0L6G6_9NEIS|nr:3'-5' exonuclease [Chromobacterium haemolyticum]NHR05217.1 3'-5' exonuclease domain-containing protein 2 [Chromobacterium haemolyticum]